MKTLITKPNEFVIGKSEGEVDCDFHEDKIPKYHYVYEYAGKRMCAVGFREFTKDGFVYNNG